MTSEYTFYDYIDADGINVIRSWLNGDGKGAKAFFTMIIPRLEASPPPGWKDSVWVEPHYKRMSREWDGFIELRKGGSVQYRLLAQMRGRNVFLVACGFHRGKGLDTDVSPQTALNRVAQMINNPTKCRREHEYN